MSTFYRRDGKVKFLPPKKLFEGFRPAIAIPATLFAAVVVGVAVVAFHRKPPPDRWLVRGEHLEWRATPAGASADARLLFEPPDARARTPTAAVRAADAGLGHGAPAAGRVVSADRERIVIEHALAGEGGRRYLRSELRGFAHAYVVPDSRVQRGDAVAEGGEPVWTLPDDPAWRTLPEVAGAAPPIREAHELEAGGALPGADLQLDLDLLPR